MTDAKFTLDQPVLFHDKHYTVIAVFVHENGVDYFVENADKPADRAIADEYDLEPIEECDTCGRYILPHDGIAHNVRLDVDVYACKGGY